MHGCECVKGGLFLLRLQVRMAYLAVIASKHVNGVAKIHSGGLPGQTNLFATDSPSCAASKLSRLVPLMISAGVGGVWAQLSSSGMLSQHWKTKH
jgi:hypothetical protein